jgi:hypothetical protein
LSVDIKQTKFFHNIGVNFFDRNENNFIYKKFDIDNNDFVNLQFIESQKDNTSLNTNLFYYMRWGITRNDSIKTAISLTKIEYNTPSKFNKDNRDEINNIFFVEYIKKISEILTINSKLYYSQKHLVFIYKERSSQNN